MICFLHCQRCGLARFVTLDSPLAGHASRPPFHYRRCRGPHLGPMSKRMDMSLNCLVYKKKGQQLAGSSPCGRYSRLRPLQPTADGLGSQWPCWFSEKEIWWRCCEPTWLRPCSSPSSFHRHPVRIALFDYTHAGIRVISHVLSRCDARSAETTAARTLRLSWSSLAPSSFPSAWLWG